jgi:hypothetical protein
MNVACDSLAMAIFCLFVCLFVCQNSGLIVTINEGREKRKISAWYLTLCQHRLASARRSVIDQGDCKQEEGS